MCEFKEIIDKHIKRHQRIADLAYDRAWFKEWNRNKL